MAEFLVRTTDCTHKDLDTDKCCWKRGDVIQVYEDGVCKEPPSPKVNVCIIKIPGLTLEEAEKYTESEIVGNEVIRRRKLRMDMSTLSAGDLAKEASSEIITISKELIDGKFKATSI
jgi:hypothetical protein